MWKEAHEQRFYEICCFMKCHETHSLAYCRCKNISKKCWGPTLLQQPIFSFIFFPIKFQLSLCPKLGIFRLRCFENFMLRTRSSLKPSLHQLQFLNISHQHVCKPCVPLSPLSQFCAMEHSKYFSTLIGTILKFLNSLR